MACIIYYQNLDYDQLPTARKRARMMPSSNSSSNSSPYPMASAPTSYSSTSYSSTTSSYTPPQQVSNTSTSFVPAYRVATAQVTNSSAPMRTISPRTPAKIYDHNKENDNDATQLYTSPYFRKTATTTSGAVGTGRPNSINYITNTPPTRPYPTPSANQSPDSYCTQSSDPPTQDELIATLKKYFGFDSFRGNQKVAVEATCAGLDTLILMPTGGGKSICYQLPAILSRGLTIVVSPLKSLIADQVNRLRSLNIKTSALFGETDETEAAEIYMDLTSHDPKHKLLYVTPEKINLSTNLMNLFRSLHQRQMLARFVIDEAHCVSMWGSDFRPDYRKLGKLRDLFKDVPIMALTATAPIKVRDDIYDQLKMNHQTGKTFVQSFNRPNLKFEVRVKQQKTCIDDIAKIASNQFHGQCGIIYCLSRKECEQIAERLRDRGITSAPYHAGLSDAQRKRVFQAWSDGVFQVVCATIAFGMGIDKSNVRFVIHYSVPKSIEGYYQEAGRAGRDGQFALCILYFSKSDLYRMKSMLSKGIGRKASDKERDRSNLDSITAYVDNKTECRRSILLHYLGEEFDRKNCLNHLKTACDNCLAQNKMVQRPPPSASTTTSAARRGANRNGNNYVPSNYEDF